MLVIACNTATAVALEEIKRKIIDSGNRGHTAWLSSCCQSNKNQQIGVIGTAGTIKSNAYEEAIKLKSPRSVVVSLKACPKFAPIVESNQAQSSVAKNRCRNTAPPQK